MKNRPDLASDCQQGEFREIYATSTKVEPNYEPIGDQSVKHGDYGRNDETHFRTVFRLSKL